MKIIMREVFLVEFKHFVIASEISFLIGFSVGLSWSTNRLLFSRTESAFHRDSSRRSQKEIRWSVIPAVEIGGF